ncbi:cytochrome P450 [Mycobacterium heidelbergense]|uniref:cytochrome P450 n=1 Tax=Mycobacterium heidelbergense TaxID=53376 RepID=UPI003CEE34D5
MTSPNSIPIAPGALPLLGHLVPLIRDPYEFLTSLPAHGDVVRVRLGPATMVVVVCDPGLTDRVLRDDRTFDKGGPIYDRAREVLGDSLSTCPHSLHRRQRRLAQPAFHSARMPGYAQIMTDHIRTVTGSWHDRQMLDVLSEMFTITSRITTATMFSDTVPPATQRQVIDDFAHVIAGVYTRALIPAPLDRLPTPGNRRYHRARARLQHTVGNLISDRRATGTDHGDLLSALLSAHDDLDTHDGNLSDTEITNQVLAFYLAGTETTATVLAWALHEVAHHPRIEQALRTEVDAVLGGRPATHADLPRLELTGRIITETMRLWPPGWWLTRATTADTQLGEHLVAKGTVVVCSPYLIHRRPDLYPEPDRFVPDRWIPDARPQRDAYIPFVSGARKCIGERFGYTEAVLALATIAARWQLVPQLKPPVRPTRMGVVIRPRGLRMRTAARIPTSSRQPSITR